VGSSAVDGITNDGALTVSGEAGALIEYSIDAGTTWTAGFTAAEGANSVQVRQTDEAGNISASSTAMAFTLDTTAPVAAPSIALTNDTGSSAVDGITNDGALTVSGEAGALIEYSIDAGVTWTAGFTAAEGANSVQVRQTDEAGNISPASTALIFTLDTTAPVAAPSIALTNDTGSSAVDDITNDGAGLLSGCT